jgi:hypothetical protein
MSDPWDEDPLENPEPWNDDPNIDDVFPPGSKSEKVLRDSAIFGGRFDPVAVGETVLGVGSSIYDAIASGTAGAVGAVAGMVPGGESPNEKGERWRSRAEGMYQYEPRTQGGQAGMEMVGKGMEKVMEGAKYVGSGYAGMGALAAGADAEEATQSMQDFRETPDALGEGVFEYTQSPTMAVVAQLLPEVASLGIPGSKARPPKPKPTRYPEAIDLPEGYGGIGDAPPRPIPETGPGGRPQPDVEVPSQDLYNQVEAAIKSGDKQGLLELIREHRWATPLRARSPDCKSAAAT